MKRCLEERVCEICKTVYVAKVVSARFCSLKCMYVWRSTLPKKERPKIVQKIKVLGKAICPYCKKDFDVLKNRKEFCSKLCMYEQRKQQNWEVVNCLNCKKEFKRRKNEKNHRTGLPKQYCSSMCANVSDERREKLRSWGLSDHNHWKRKEIQAKVKKTKKEKYGDENYNNSKQQVKTSFQKYGTYSFWLGEKSQGKRISKIQRYLYEKIKKVYPSTELEFWITKAKRSVDIFIPEKNEIVEVYGTYWHCDPRKYKPDYYNKLVKMTAQEIWEKDLYRQTLLESFGYKVNIAWESDIKQNIDNTYS